VPRGNGTYGISGQKIFISGGEHDLTDNIIHLVLARLPDAPAGSRGISLFLAPKFLVNPDGSLGARNDLVCASVEHKLGIHASPTAVMSFGEKGGAIGYLIGEANRGLEYMFTMMNHARFSVGLEGVAIAERAMQQAFAYALDRVQGRPIGCEAGKPIAYHPDVKRMLLDMKARVEALRATAYFTAGRMDVAAKSPDAAAAKKAQALVDLLVPVVKGFSTESSVWIASTGVQVHGGMGYVEETGAAQHYRDARITPIYEGTTGIQANDFVGRKIARDGGAAAKLLIANLQAEVGDDAALAGALKTFGEVVGWIADTHAANPERTAAGAVAVLSLAGIVIGACLLEKQARVAKAQLDGGDAAFLSGKIAIARYFTAHVLPQVDGLARAITQGHEAINAFDPGAI
jgi:acyl-CoA dehydrogenase